eukprot:618530-Amphidinium_carterae.1
MQVIGSDPAAIHVSLGKVRLYPANTLSRQQSVLDPELQVSISAFGLTSACLQRLHRFDSSLTVTNHFMWLALLKRSSDSMELRTINGLLDAWQGTKHSFSSVGVVA